MWRWLFLSGCLLIVSLSRPSQAADPPFDTRPIYRNPLDVTVDTKGERARVLLTGPRTMAVVDLASGKVIEESPWPKDRPLPTVEDRSLHVPDSLRQKAMELQLPGVSNIRAVCADEDETFLLVAHQIPKTNVPATQVAQGWVFVNAVTRYRLQRVNEGAWLLPQRQTAVLDQPSRAFADPSDVVLDPRGRLAFVACAGADKVLVIDLRRLHAIVDRFGQETGHSYPAHLQLEDLTVRRDYIVGEVATGANPRRLGLSGDGKVLVASNHLADSLTVIDAEKLKVIKHIPLAGSAPLGGLAADSIRRGETLFNSAKLTFQGQFTCASCHPNGGADGLNWDLTRDGVGTFKNTKPLLGIKETAPYGWLGTSLTLEDRIRGTLRTLHRYEPSEEEVSDLAAYLRSLPVPSESARAFERESAERGKAIFEGKGRCSACHSGQAFDDGKLHDVGTAEPNLNTPSLLGVSRTAPYLHDGRSATLEDIFTKHNVKNRHGDAHELTPEELKDLIAYLKSL
jgi:YVTN family beta-propeller protein